MRYELKKIFSKKVVLSILLILNVNLMLLLLYIYGTGQMYSIPAHAYRNVFQEMQEKNNIQKAEYLKTKSAQMDNLATVEDYQTKNMLQKLALEAQQSSEYEAYLTQLEQEMLTKESIGILSDNSSFSVENAIKMRGIYQNLHGTEVSFEAYEGVLLVDFTVTNILLVFLIAFLASNCVVQEKEDGILQILRCCKNGRGALIAKKVLSLLFVCAVLCALFLIENLIVGAFAYGIGDLFRPIQSVPDYAAFPLKITVLTFLILVWAIRVLTTFLVALFVLLLSTVVYQMIIPLVVTIIIGGISWVLFSVIDIQSAAVFFYYVNPVSMLKTLPLLKGEVNLNILGNPVNPMIVAVVIGLITGILLLIGVTVLFVSTREEIRCNFQWRGIKSKRYGSFTLMGMESYKLWNIRMGKVFLFTVLIIQMMLYPKNYLATQEEICESEYIMKLSEMDRDAQEEMIVAELEKVSQHIDSYGDNVKRYILEERIVPLYENLSLLRTQGEEAEFIQQTGYEKLFGVANQSVDKKNTLIYITLMVFVCGLYSTMEQTSGMKILINVTESGWEKVKKSKIKNALIFSVIGMIIVWLPDMVWYFRQYDLYDWNAKMSWLLAFEGWSNKLSIGAYFILLCIVRIIAGILLARLILTVSSSCKTTMSSLSISTFLFVIPSVLALMNVPGMDQYTFHALLDGNMVLHSGMGIWGYLAAVLGLYVFCLYIDRNLKIKNI